MHSESKVSARRGRAAGAAFTLVELLVVIGIIAVLIGILLPALSKSREQAKITVCLSNLRQMAAAAHNYAANNKGSLPIHLAYNDPATSWDDIAVSSPLNGVTNSLEYHPSWLGGIYPYMKAAKVMTCPSHPEADEIADTARSANGEQVIRTYHANGVVLWNGGKRLRHAAETILFKDEGSVNATTGAVVRPRFNRSTAFPTPASDAQRWSGWMYFGSPTDPNAGTSGKVTDKYHKGEKQCMSFVDGHAEVRHWKDINCLAFGLEPIDNGDGTKMFYEPAIGTTYATAGRMMKRRVD